MRTTELRLDTRGSVVTDITRQVRAFASDGGGDGLLTVFVPHATAGVAIVETGSGSESDLEAAVERLLPRQDIYAHRHGSTGHGADHVLPAFIAPSTTLIVTGGEVVLGTWQSVVVADTNRENDRRRVVLAFLPSP